MSVIRKMLYSRRSSLKSFQAKTRPVSGFGFGFNLSTEAGYGVMSPPNIERIRSEVDSYEYYLDAPVPSLQRAFTIQNELQKSGSRDVELERKVNRLVRFARAHEWYGKHGNLISLLMIHLMCINRDLRGFRRNRDVRMVHCLSLKLVVADPDWFLSKLMGLYESNGDMVSVEKLFLSENNNLIDVYNQMIQAFSVKLGDSDLGFLKSRMMGIYDRDMRSIVRMFYLTSESKGLAVYNQMVSLRATYAPEKAPAVVATMIKKGYDPTNVTFRGLLAALSLVAKPEAIDDAVYVIKNLKRYEVEAQFYHYGALVDLLARTRKSCYIGLAVDVIKGLPLSRDQQSFNSVLSRCVLERTPETAEEKKELEKMIFHVQDLVDFLEDENYRYAVLDKTYWRLKKLELNWPKGVRKIEEPPEVNED